MALTAEYNDLELAIFDDADLTAQPKLLRKITSQSPNCQIVALSSTPNQTWQQNIKLNHEMTQINVPVTDAFYGLNHCFAVCASFTEKINMVVAICEILRTQNAKAILFTVSINLILFLKSQIVCPTS